MEDTLPRASLGPKPAKLTKETYLAYRSAFPAVVSFEDALGRINPYTEEPVSCYQDYELYCLAHFLKSTSEAEANMLRHDNDSLSREIRCLQAEVEDLKRKMATIKRKIKILVCCLVFISGGIIFYTFSQLFSFVIPPIYWLYFLVVLFFPTLFLSILIRYRKKSLSNEYTSVIVSLFIFIVVMILGFVRHFFI